MSNNNYDLIYVTLNGNINIIKKNVWQTQNNFDGSDSSNITSINNIFKVSKITQINTGEFLYLGDDCNVYKVGSSFTNPVPISDKQFTGITMLSNYKILLTSKDGKMYTVDDVNNFDNTINPFFDDSTSYASVKQTFDGYVVAIDSTQCGTSWRFDLIKNQLFNKTKLNLDDAYTNRVTLFTPDQANLINLNCDPRYKDTIYKYVFSDKTFESSNDSRCMNGQEYESFNKKCYNICPSGYESHSGDILSCWTKCKSGDINTPLTCMDSCRSGYTNILGVCTNNTVSYDRGIGIAPDSTCTGCACVVDNARYCNSYGPRKKSLKTRSCGKSCSSGYTNNKDIACDVIGSCYKYVDGDCVSYSCKDGYTRVGTGTAVTCWEDVKCKSSCKSNRNLEVGMCYIPCKDGYTGNITMCNPTDSMTYIPQSTVKGSVTRGQSYDPVSPKDITCNSNCCMFDLCFYNTLYLKPVDIVLPFDLPVQEGLVGFYDGNSFKNNIWYDSSPSNNNAVYVKGTFKKSVDGTFISGTPSSSILFPTQILPTQYTVFNIGKYNGTSKGKILSGYLNNWFSGFANGMSGVAGRDKPITQMSLSAFDDNWVFSMDTNTIYGANGTNYTTVSSPDSVKTQLSINLNDDPNSNSDFAIACVIVFNRTLTDSEIQSMQTWLTTKYADLYASTYTKTFGQLGYSCFNGSVGKVTNNYSNYTYASYKNGTVDCKWLNLPEKKNFDPLICTTVSSENYETFNNTNNSNYLFSDYIFYLLIIILIIIIIKRCNKD